MVRIENCDLIPGLRVIQLALAFITLGLNAYVVAWYNAHELFQAATPDSKAFLVFCAVWTILIYLPYIFFGPRYFPCFMLRGYGSLVVEAATVTLWFAGWIADAVFLGRLPSCGGQVCQCAVAGVVFAVLEWLLCLTSLYFPVMYLFFDKPGFANRANDLRGARARAGARTSNHHGMYSHNEHHRHDRTNAGDKFSSWKASLRETGTKLSHLDWFGRGRGEELKSESGV